MRRVFRLQPSYQAAYFVSKNGNDTYDGTKDRPFATVAKALSVVMTGETIYLRSGVYSEYVVVNKEQVTVKAWNGETVVLRPAATGTANAVWIAADHVTFDGVIVDAVNRWRGVDVSAAYFTFRNFEVMNCIGNVVGRFGQGVTMSHSLDVHDITIQHGRIHDVNGTTDEAGFCHGIYAACAKLRVEDVEIYNIGGYGLHWYSGISEGGDVQMSKCYLHDLRYGVGLYAEGDALIWNNVIRRAIQGIVCRQAITLAELYYNTITDTLLGAIDIEALADGATVIAAYNVLHIGRWAANLQNADGAAVSVEMHHNLRSQMTDPDANVGAVSESDGWHVAHINATFAPVTDDGRFGIKPTAGNPAIGAGVLLTDIATDCGGSTRNNPTTLGAWEAA